MVCLSENVMKLVPFIPVTSYISVTAFLGLQSHFSGFKAAVLSLAPWPTCAEGKQVTSYAPGATTPGNHGGSALHWKKRRENNFAHLSELC